VKGVVAWDSYYGNTATVAATIADELRGAGHDVRLVDLHHERVSGPDLAADSGFLVLGGPTRMKHISRRARSFAKKLDARVWAGKPALVYDTYGPLDPDPAKNEGSKWLYPGGGVELRELLVQRGLAVVPEELRCLVAEMKGPLVEGALDEARSVAQRFVRRL
jgi:flavodoxin